MSQHRSASTTQHRSTTTQRSSTAHAMGTVEETKTGAAVPGQTGQRTVAGAVTMAAIAATVVTAMAAPAVAAVATVVAVVIAVAVRSMTGGRSIEMPSGPPPGEKARASD